MHPTFTAITASPITITKKINKMSLPLYYYCCCFFFLVSSVTACDRCVHQTRVAFFSKASSLSSGACGYGSLAGSFNRGKLAAVVPSIYKDGAGCGSCFQVRCKNTKLCSAKGTKVIVTDLNQINNHTADFVLSSRAFKAMANKGMGQDILKHGHLMDVEYKRIPCDQDKNQTLAVRVQETSRKPKYLAVNFLYQGGQTEIVGVDVAQVGSPNWTFMARKNHSAVWETDMAPSGALQFRLVVTSGYDGKWIWMQNVLPPNWDVGSVYKSRVQITDIAKEGCSPCDDAAWI